jgi:hypothetical protein
MACDGSVCEESCESWANIEASMPLNPNNLHDSFCVFYFTNRGLEGQLPFVIHTSLLLLHEQLVYTA